MRLGTVIHADRPIVAAAVQGGLVDLTAACGFGDMMAVITGGPEALAAARRALSGPVIAEVAVSFRAPLMPAQLHDCLAFEAHLLNAFPQSRTMTGRSFDIP